MALFTYEDVPNETITGPAKEIPCTTKIGTTNYIDHSHEFKHTDSMADHESIIATESSQEASLHHSTMESEIDQTAELLPSGSIQSLQNGIKQAVSETSPPQLISSVFIPKASDYSIEENPRLSLPTYHDNVTADLYSDGTCGTPVFPESIKQYGDHNDEDLYTDSKFCAEKNISFSPIHTPAYMKDLSRGILSKLEMTNDIMFKNKVWNVPNPEESHRKRTDYQMQCPKIGEYIETDEETFMHKSTVHESQDNGPLYQQAVTSQCVRMLQVNNATDDIKLKHAGKLLQDDMIKDYFSGEHNACYQDQTPKSDHCINKEVNQCEGETRKAEVYLKTINKEQKLDIESDALKNAESKETCNIVSGITSISKVPCSPVTFLSLGVSNTNTDNPPQSDSQRLSYFEESQSSAHLNIPTCVPQEDQILSSRDIEDQPHMCSNNDSIETHDDRKGDDKMKHFEARNNITNKLEFQRDLSTMCPEKVETRESTPILNELSNSQSQEISGITPGHDFISSDKAITMKDSSKIFLQRVENDSGIKTLFECSSEGKLEPYLEVIDQQGHVSPNAMNISKHHSMDDSNITEVKKKPCHSPDENSETPYGKESPNKEVESGSVLKAKSNKDSNDTITCSQMMSNESLQVNNLQVFSRSSDPSINSSDLSCESTIDSLAQCTTTISDSTNWCTINPLDPSKASRKTVQEISVMSKIACRDPSGQFTSVSHTSTYQGTKNSSDSSALCTKTSTDQSDDYRSTMSDVSYQDKFSSLQTTDHSPTITVKQCLTSCPESANYCKNNSSDLSHQFTSTFSDPFKNCNHTVPDGTNQCTLSNFDSIYQRKNDSSDSSALCAKTSTDQHDHCRTTLPDWSYQGISSETFIKCNTSAQDPSKQCTPANLDSTYQWKNDSSGKSFSSDSSTMCMAASSDPFYQSKTTTGQLKISSLDTSDQCTTMNPDSALQCSIPSLNSSDQCTTSFLESTNQCKTTYLICPTSALITSDPSNQYPAIAPDSCYQSTFTSRDPPEKYTTKCSDFTYNWTNNPSDVPKHTATSPESSDQYNIPAIYPLDQCTTMTSDPTYPDLSYEEAITSSDRCDQCKTTSLNSSDECKTISLPSFPESNNQHTSCQTTPHHIMTNSSDLHENDSSDQTALPETNINNEWMTNTLNPSLACRVNSADPIPPNTTLNSNQSLKVSTSDSMSDTCTPASSDHINESKTTPSNHSAYGDMSTIHRLSYQYKADLSNDIHQFTNTSPNQHDQCIENSIDPFNQCASSTSSSHQCRTIFPNAFPDPLFSLPNLLQLNSASTSDLCTSTTNPDLPVKSTAIFGDPDLPCTAISPFSGCQHETTSTQSLDQCINISGDFQLSLPCENNIECRSLKEPTQDEYGGIIKQRECSFLEEVRRIYLDSQVVGFSQLDSGIILVKEKRNLGNIVLMILRNGKELGTVIQSSKLYLHYQLDKHFLVTQRLNEYWYHTQDRITKVTMLMKKVPLTSNWLKTLHNFLCLPNDRSFLTPYAVVTDRNGSILFLMEDRDLLGVGKPPLGYELNTMKNLSTVLCFMKYCRIHGVLPRKIANSILYTPQGICFDPSSFCNNEDHCEFNKCLKEYLLVFLFGGQQEEFDGIIELFLERSQLLLEEDWSSQICLARLLSAPMPGALPFCFSSFPNEN